MTKQEAIEYIIEHCNPDYPKEDGTQWIEAMNMAIEALSELDSNSTKVDNKNDELSCSEKPNSSDSISRQDAIYAIVNTPTDVYSHDRIVSVLDGVAFRQNEIIDIINAMPSVQAERNKGKWDIWRDCEGKSRYVTCNLCGHKEFNWYDPNFCPHCGARMEGES